jgi:hypothetical protein
MTDSVAAVGAELVAVKINKMHPDVVVLTLEVPGEFRSQALELAKMVGYYFEGIAFMNPKEPIA